MVRLASAWRDGLLPEAGGINDQPAWTAAAVQIVLAAWGRMEAAERKKLRKE